MPVKLINSNARGYFTSVLYELIEETGRRTPPNSTNVVRQMTQERFQEIIDFKSKIERWSADQILWNKSNTFPELIGDWNGKKFHKVKIRGKLILFKNTLYDVSGLFSDDEARLAVQKKYQKERSEIDFLKSRADGSQTGREFVPERIRNEVWRRDGGKCVECGSIYNLEFDHVIPVAKGGGNTARNLRILCEPCNRRKSDSIG